MNDFLEFCPECHIAPGHDPTCSRLKQEKLAEYLLVVAEHGGDDAVAAAWLAGYDTGFELGDEQGSEASFDPFA